MPRGAQRVPWWSLFKHADVLRALTDAQGFIRRENCSQVREPRLRGYMNNGFVLNFGPCTLSRIYCGTCKEETLHVRGLCNHCAGLRRNGSASTVRLARRPRVSKTESPWRADHDLMCKARAREKQRDKIEELTRAALAAGRRATPR